jgi:CheY-like chemotaxis protein
VVEVEDTGVGIAADQISRIFDYFEQAGRGLQTGGTGLGLAISRAYVRLMGGDIAVRSEVGQGSVFRFEVVLEPAAPEPAVPAPAGRVLGLGPSQPPVRILVVDDQPVMRDLLTDLLVPLGFELREAASGEEALRQFEAWKPHLILMDLRMPGMDGYEATRRIRARAEGAEVPIIAVTASAFEENQQEILAAGANDFLAKPFRLSDLLEKMGAFLDVDVYAEAAPSPAEGPPDGGTTNVREALASLPGELVNSLRDAALRADLDRVLALVDQVEAHDARVAEELRRVAEQFDFRHLRDLLGGGA